MRQIYLASDSPARRKLLEMFGLKFKVLSGRIEKEKMSGKNYPAIVKANALKKAKAAAKRVKNGIIIAADTIVVQDKNIFGKPKDLKGARLMLKKLSAKPQWLYTGIAVIDKDKGKTKLACEKTRVYMDKLSDKEIDNYFKRVNPLDKAGSFDIQGRGAFFIRRIEGCFYNVVGLPLRRLYRLLKELGVTALVILFCLILSGCATEYNIVTGQQESYFYTTEREVQIGQSISKQVEKEMKLAEDPLLAQRVKQLGDKIVSVCDRKDIDYHFKVLEEEEVNAFALPGGFIYINKGLIEKTVSDDELAGVIAHEIGHVVARHSIKKLQAITGYSILRILTSQIPNTGGQAGNAADYAFTEILLGYGRDDELLADQLGTRYLLAAGFNPRGMISFLEKLQEVHRRKPAQPKTYFKTHPYVPDRIRTVKTELGEKIDFTDYINIEETKDN